jgi:hypothetical protein
MNGERGYKWQPDDEPSIYPINPPAVAEGDVVLYDEPGRCGGLDAHSHHYRVVKHYSSIFLYVQHGGGKEEFRLSTTPAFMAMLAALDTNARYWMLSLIYHAHSDGERKGSGETQDRWSRAAAEKRIKTRKYRNSNDVKVWIEDPPVACKAV